MPSFKPFASFAAAALLLCAPTLAFDTPLSEQAVREGYFLGQRHDESMAVFLNKYTKLLPPPETGPYIYSVTFLTPYALLVKYSSRQSNYSAQQAAIDHKAQDEVVEISIEILLTQSYGAYLTAPTSSRPGSPTGVQLRSSDFWRTLKFRVFDGGEEISTDDLTGDPTYRCVYKGGCLLTGAIVHLQFPAAAFRSDSATIDITPPEGDPISVDFDLSTLR